MAYLKPLKTHVKKDIGDKKPFQNQKLVLYSNSFKTSKLSCRSIFMVMGMFGFTPSLQLLLQRPYKEIPFILDTRNYSEYFRKIMLHLITTTTVKNTRWTEW